MRLVNFFMKKIKWTMSLLAVVSIAIFTAYFTIFHIPDSATLTVNTHTTTSQKSTLQCYENPTAAAIDVDNKIDVLVWNIFKQSKDNWQQQLQQYSKNSQLALLQEVSMTEAFKTYSQQSAWFSSHVDAFRVFGTSTGVLTLSIQSPLKACAHIEYEPWIQLPKSGIYAEFKLSDGRTLVVVNLHSVNFTYGVEEYQLQLSVLAEALKKHQGPIIFAGDLNAWNLERINIIEKQLNELGLTEVQFEPDHRKEFINGMALDYVFYRQLTVLDAQTPITNASDHNPLKVIFGL